MKKTLIALSCICASMMLAAADQSAAGKAEPKPVNLIRNANFQEWSAIGERSDRTANLVDNQIPTYWNVESEGGVVKGTVSRDLSGTEKDKFCLKIVNTKTVSTDVNTFCNEFIKVKPKTTYVFRCKIKGENIKPDDIKGGAPFVWVNFGPEDYFANQQSIAKNLKTGTYDWETFEMTAESNDKAELCIIRLQLRFATGTVWYDDVELFEKTK